MPEYIQIDGTETKVHLTATAGFIIGLVAAGLVSAIVVSTQKSEWADEKTKSVQEVTHGYEAKLEALQQEKTDLAASFPCDVVPRLVEERSSALTRMQQKIVAFPEFKTEPFKAAYNELTRELEVQTEEVRVMREGLKADGLGTSATCNYSAMKVAHLIGKSEGSFKVQQK
jgi:hypothetical protein